MVEAIIEKIIIGNGEIDITLSHMPSSEELCKNQHQLGTQVRASAKLTFLFKKPHVGFVKRRLKKTGSSAAVPSPLGEKVRMRASVKTNFSCTQRWVLHTGGLDPGRMAQNNQPPCTLEHWNSFSV